MARPNFFCSVEALQTLIGSEFPDIEPETELTVDLIEAPYLFLYTVEPEAWNLKVFSRGELYDHTNGSGVVKGELRVERSSGSGTGKTSDQALSQNMGAFFHACQQLSRYIRKENLSELYKGLDPEKAGVMLETSGGELKARVVAGSERPEMMCDTLFGGRVMCRPYMEDFMDRSEREMMDEEELTEAAEEGDADAMEELARAYLDGDGDREIEQNFEKAFYWTQKWAETGSAVAMFNTGLFLAKGCGTERSFEKAAEWMDKAAEEGDADAPGAAKKYRGLARLVKKAQAGDPQAMAELAGEYMSMGGSLQQAGEGEDYAESLKWAQRAVDAGCAAGCWPLALAYEHGRGVKADKQKAAQLYRRGAEGGNAACQHSYGCLLINGDGVKKDAKAALDLFEKSADQGYVLAYKALGHMYETGEGVEPDFDRELENYEKACLADPSDGEFLRHVAFQYTNLMDSDDEKTWAHGVERAAHWLREAAERGDRVAAGSADMFEHILEQYRKGEIPAGSDMSACMERLSGDGGEKDKENAEAGQQEKTNKKPKQDPGEENVSKKLHLFVEGSARDALLTLDLGRKDVPRHSYTVDLIDIPVTCSVVWSDGRYTVSGNTRFDTGNTDHSYGKPLTVPLGSDMSIDSERDGADVTIKKICAAIASQMDKLLPDADLPAIDALPDPEHGGIRVSEKDGKPVFTVVEGADRPEMQCFASASLVTGDLRAVMDRPYADELPDKLKAAADARRAEDERKKKEEAARREEEERKKKEEEARRRAEREKKEKERRRAEEEKRSAAEKYRSEKAAWESECGRIRRQRKERLDRFENDQRKKLEDEAKTRLDRDRASAQDAISQAEEKKAAAEKRLSELGFFSFSDKKQQKQKIEEAELLIAEGQEAIAKAEEKYSAAKEAISKKVKKECPAEEKRLEKELPLPAEPKKPAFILEEERRQTEEAAKKARMSKKNRPNSIPEAMERNKPYTAEEVGELFGEDAAWAAPKLNALVTAGVLSKIVDKRKSYFFLN